MSKTIRWGIIGCGNVCEVKSGPGFQRAEGSALSVVMRRDGDAARDFARRHGVPRWTDNAAAVIEGDDVDAVYVASPVGSHLEHALAAAQAGKPCYVEKPMARNHAECARMVGAFAARGVPLFVAYYRRALPRFVEAKRLIESGAIGKVSSVTVRCTEPRHRGVDRENLSWRLVAELSGGGIFFDLGSHILDAVDFMLGPITAVAGEARNVGHAYDVEDCVSMHWAHGSGATGVGQWNFASDQRQDRITIDGTDGQVSLACFAHDRLTVRRGDEVSEQAYPDPKHIQQPLIQTMVNELRGLGQCVSTGTSAARTAAVMDAATWGYYGGRSDAFWERPESWPGRPPRK